MRSVYFYDKGFRRDETGLRLENNDDIGDDFMEGSGKHR